MFFPESRNYYSTRDEVLIKELARFRAFTDQLLRVQSRAITLARMGEISKREAAATMASSQVFASMWYNGLKWVIGSLIWGAMTGKEAKEKKEVFIDMVLAPLSWIPFIGWTAQTSISSLLQDGYGPAAFSNIVADRLTHVSKSMYMLFMAAKFAINDEKDSKGQWKSERYFKKGMKMAAEDTLVLLGLPKWGLDLIPEDDQKSKSNVIGGGL
jgi:hypothetical protein